MDTDEKSKLEHIRDDLVKLTADMAIDDEMPPEERISLLMAKIRTNPDTQSFHAAKQAIDEIESKEVKLNAALDLIAEIEIALGNVTADDEQGDQPTQTDADQRRKESSDDEQEHLVPSPHPEDHQGDSENTPVSEEDQPGL